MLYLALILATVAFLPLLLPNPPVVLTLACAWASALCVCLVCFLFANSSTHPAHREDTDSAGGCEPNAHDSDNTRFAHIISAIEAISQLGPSADLAETKRKLVNVCSVGMDTDLAALFTIDPCTGNVECESTAGVSKRLQQATLRLLDRRLSDRDQTHAWAVTGFPLAETGDSGAARVFADCGVRTVIACPVRSQTSACGALAAFFTTEVDALQDKMLAIEVLAAQTSTVLSYALTLEQSRYLLDDLAGANQELSLQATVDGLTGLPNHRAFQQTLSDMCRRSQRKGGRPLCVVMVDVDHFKIYNDTYGHREGDAVLQKVGKIMAAGLRHGDMAARYGGEEFALIFQNITKDDALAAADRIRRAIADQTFRKGVVTVSMGLAEFPLDASSPGELVERADKALYHAKVTGRNRVFAWGTLGTRAQNGNDGEDTRTKAVLVLEQPDDPCAGVLKDTLTANSCAVESAANITEAAELLKTRTFDIALVSLEALPDCNVKSLSTLAAIHPHMPIVLLAIHLPAQDSREALRRGASDILLKPYNPAELPVVVERNIERQRLELQRLMQKSTGVMLQAIEALVAAIDAKDPFTAGHSQRVTALSLALCDDLKLSNEERYALELAAKLHDIGKLALPDSALNKQSPLTEEEWQAMREHPAQGARIVGAISELAYVSTIIRHHHERLDGTGYPDGLTGPAIPYMSRIIAVADAYEAMTSERAHRSRLTPAEAVAELRRHSGTYYEPEVIDVLERQLAARGEITLTKPDQRAA